MTVVKVFCTACRFLLLKYNKAGRGALVKLNPQRVIDDRTCSKAPLKCPACAKDFARETKIQGRPFRKLLGGSVFVKGGGITAR